MRAFVLRRNEDYSGVSGTGDVAEGVEFTDGTCALRWMVKNVMPSTGIYPSIEALQQIHGHEGRTVVVFEDRS